MNILLTIHHHLDPNAGAAGVTLKLGQKYQQAGHQVSYFSFDNLPSKLPEIIKAIAFPYCLAAYLLTAKQPIDVIDASTGDVWLWTKLFRRFRPNSALITRSHGLEHTLHLENLVESASGNLNLSWKYPVYHGGFRLWEVETSIKHADLTLMLNSRDRDYAHKELRIAREKLTIVPNGIPDYLLNLPFEAIANEEVTIRIAQVGTFIPRKGIKYSIPALNNILSRYPQVEMSFLGTACRECTSVEQVYNNFAPEVRDRVKVIPSFEHQKLPQLLKGHHIKLFPSLYEGFGMALIEAMACGLAPVATATSGPIDIISDRQDGLLVPLRDSQAIENALEELIRDRSELARLRRNAYQTAQNYSWTDIARQNLALYGQVLQSKNKKAGKVVENGEMIH